LFQSKVDFEGMGAKPTLSLCFRDKLFLGISDDLSRFGLIHYFTHSPLPPRLSDDRKEYAYEPIIDPETPSIKAKKLIDKAL
jgi:hypothetical protein